MISTEGGFGDVEYVTGEELKLLGYDKCKEYCDKICGCGFADKCAISEITRNEEKEFSIWLKRHQDPDNIFGPGMNASQALNFLKDYLLGEDWYISDPIGVDQANTVIVDEILRKYSKKYKKELKKYKR